MSLLNGGSTVIGPATSLEVKEGDKLKLDANLFFVEDNNDGVFPGLMAFLASSFGVSNGAGSETAHIYEGLENASNLLVLSLTNSPNAPRAYLMCMVFDQDYVLIDPGGTTSIPPYRKLPPQKPKIYPWR
ncbi:MAG: hypothetical protein RIG77_04715 [Cyclobacteriaceae bacterium]